MENRQINLKSTVSPPQKWKNIFSKKILIFLWASMCFQTCLILCLNSIFIYRDTCIPLHMPSYSHHNAAACDTPDASADIMCWSGFTGTTVACTPPFKTKLFMTALCQNLFFLSFCLSAPARIGIHGGAIFLQSYIQYCNRFTPRRQFTQL